MTVPNALTGYQAIVTDIESWNQRAAEAADMLYLLQIQRLQIIETGKDLKMPARMVAGSMDWPVVPVAGMLTIQAFRDAVNVAFQRFVGDVCTPELRAEMAQELMMAASRFDLPPPADVDEIIASFEGRALTAPTELAVKHIGEGDA